MAAPYLAAMTDIADIAGTRVLFVSANGAPLDAGSAGDLLGEAWGAEADLVAVPVARLAEGFLDLSTRIAGEVVQKFTNYRTRLAFVGDIAARTEASRSLRDFVFESNKGAQIWFVRDRDELETRLTAGR